MLGSVRAGALHTAQGRKKTEDRFERVGRGVSDEVCEVVTEGLRSDGGLG